MMKAMAAVFTRYTFMAVKHGKVLCNATDARRVLLDLELTREGDVDVSARVGE